ncbi:MAG: hypothetical protein QXJ45_07015, partial [Thermoproteota archaeon]
NRFIRARVNGESNSWGGEYVAYYAGVQAPTSGVVYVLVRERHDITDWYQYVNLIMSADTSGNSFYTLGYRGSELGFFDPPDLVGLWRYQGSWYTLNTVEFHLNDNTWFIFLGKRDVGSGGLSLTVYNSQGNSLATLSAQDGNILARVLGVGVRDFEVLSNNLYLTADFDDFVACANANPSFVNITGLRENWRVELYDGNDFIDSGYANSDGFVSLNVLTRPIITQGRVDIYDGNTLILRKNFNEDIVGGDVYMFASVLSNLRILRFDIQDTKPYSFSLRLNDDPDITGFVYSMDIWIQSGAQSSSPIRIRSNNVEEYETSSILLNNQGFIYLNAMVSYSSTIVLDLTFKYSLQGVEVYYPVTVTVHG